MQFRDYYYGLAVCERPAFAASVGSTVGYLNLVAGGHAKPGESLCMRIERATDRRVAVEELRPDVPWDVIRGKPAANSDRSEAA